MAEVTSGENLTVIVLNEREVEGLMYLLDSITIMLRGDENADRALSHCYELFDALGVEVD